MWKRRAVTRAPNPRAININAKDPSPGERALEEPVAANCSPNCVVFSENDATVPSAPTVNGWTRVKVFPSFPTAVKVKVCDPAGNPGIVKVREKEP